MIYLIEPLCRDVSHERVNSGLIAHLLEAFGARSLVVIAERTHMRVLKQNLVAVGVDISRVTWESIGVLPTSGVLKLCSQIGLLFRIVLRARSDDRVLFSSFDYSLISVIMAASKVLGIRLPRLYLVCHGLLDELHEGQWKRNLPRTERSLAGNGILRKTKFYLKAVQRSLNNGWLTIGVYWRYRFFPLSLVMRLVRAESVVYFVLSKHIKEKIGDLKWARKINVHSIDMPFLLAPNKPELDRPGMSMLRIAVVGNGAPSQLRRLAGHLASAVPNGGYEIQIVGMNTAGLDDLPHVHCLSPGVRMTRAAMDEAVRTIDFFLYLYDRQMFPFSCSGSFFEAYSYVKPVLCLETPCIDSYWDELEPMGIRVATIGDLAQSIARMVREPTRIDAIRAQYIQNLQKRREKLLPINQANRYRELIENGNPSS